MKRQKSKPPEDLLSLFKKHLTFRPTASQEMWLEMLSQGHQIKMIPSYRAFKTQIKNEFTYQALHKMKKGACFILCSPDKIQRFKLIEEYQSKRGK